jgi:ABC-type methionine transport system ATPase subunit
MEPVLAFHDVSVRVPGAAAPLLDAVRFAVGPGERWAVLGRSGSGKSTLLRTANRFQDLSGGRVTVDGRPVTDVPPAELRRAVALVGQEPAWLPGTARDNLLAAVALGSLDSAEAEARLPRILDRLGIEPEWLSRGRDELSGGQVRRILVGRALLPGPRVLLLDEPTASLDPPAARRLLDELRELAVTEGVALLLVSHRLEEAVRFATHAVVLHEGRLRAAGRAAMVLEELRADWETAR